MERQVVLVCPRCGRIVKYLIICPKCGVSFCENEANHDILNQGFCRLCGGQVTRQDRLYLKKD